MIFANKKSTSVTQATTNSAGFSEISGTAAAINGSGATINMLDGGAIAGAFDLGKTVLDSNNNIAGEVIRANNATAQQFGERVSTLAAQVTANQGDQLAQLGRWVVAGVVILGTAFALRKKGRA